MNNLIIKSDVKSGKATYTFKEKFNIYTVNKIKDTLIKELKDIDKLEFDLSDIKEFDSAGIQLLLFVNKEAIKTNKKVEITERSSEVLELLNFYKIAI